MHFVVLLSAVVVCAAGVPLNSTEPKPAGRIFNGVEEVSIANIPYQLSLLIDRNHVCGAVLIHSKWALTAAHCVYVDTIRVEPGRLRVGAGSVDINSPKQTRDVKIVLVHEKYNSTTHDYDIAMLQVRPGFVYREFEVEKIALAMSNFKLPVDAVISGWGRTNDNEPTSTQLRRATVTVRGKEACDGLYDGKLTDRMLCGLGKNKEQACQGDSGGPVVIHGPRSVQLIGLVSWGKNCSSGIQEVYTNVFVLRSWINRKMCIPR